MEATLKAYCFTQMYHYSATEQKILGNVWNWLFLTQKEVTIKCKNMGKIN